MVTARGTRSKKGASDILEQVAAVDKVPENGTSSQQDMVAVVKNTPKRGPGRPRKLKPAPAVDGAVDGVATKKGRSRKATSKVRNSVEPEVVNEKLKAIASIEDKAAAAYADDTTPGGVAGKLPAKKDEGGRRAGSRDKVKQTVIADTSDMSELESGLDTDVEGTVRGKGKGKSQSYRLAIQALREQPLVLESVAEDDEADTAATHTKQQPIEEVKDKDTEQGEEVCVNKDKGGSVGNLGSRGPTKEAGTIRAKSTAGVSAEKRVPAANDMDEGGDNEIEFIQEAPSPRDSNGDINMEGNSVYYPLVFYG